MTILENDRILEKNPARRNYSRKTTSERELRRRRQRKARKIRIFFFKITFTIISCSITLYILVGFWKNSELLSEQTKGNMDQIESMEENSTHLSENTIPESSQISLEDDLSEDEWCLRLVNFKNPLPENYTIQLTQLKNNQSIDSRCYPDLQEMMDACRSAGLNPVICSSYRTAEKQQALYDEEVNTYLSAGYDQDSAEKEAAKSVAPCGTSEHQLGLALDIVDRSNQRLEQNQENTPVQKWLMANSWKYGFILRYPEGKSDITGIKYEPWHYRYVGKTAAKEIYEQQICLEEYLENKKESNPLE